MDSKTEENKQKWIRFLSTIESVKSKGNKSQSKARISKDCFQPCLAKTFIMKLDSQLNEKTNKGSTSTTAPEDKTLASKKYTDSSVSYSYPNLNTTDSEENRGNDERHYAKASEQNDKRCNGGLKRFPEGKKNEEESLFPKKIKGDVLSMEREVDNAGGISKASNQSKYDHGGIGDCKVNGNDTETAVQNKPSNGVEHKQSKQMILGNSCKGDEKQMPKTNDNGNKEERNDNDENASYRNAFDIREETKNAFDKNVARRGNQEIDSDLMEEGDAHMQDQNEREGEVQNHNMKMDIDVSKSKDIIEENKEEKVMLEESNRQFFNVGRKRVRNAPSPKKRKSDVDIPCSKWTLDLFSEYFDFDSTVARLDIPQSKQSQELNALGKKIIEELTQRSKIILNTNDFFKSDHSNVRTVRIFIDAIFLALCSSFENKMHVEVEKKAERTITIPCEFDYRIINKGNVIGSIETKSRSGLKDVSIIQAALRLTVLQAELAEKSIGNIPPLFNIVTDGVRFILFQLNGEKLGFEHTHSDNLYINHVRSVEDFGKLLSKLVNLMKMSEAC